MTGHTPGPWISVPHLDEFDIFDASGVNRICGYVTTKQNANLIAALPDMLDLCHAIVIAVDNGLPIDRDGLRELAANAIAKAEGRDG